MKRKIRLPKDIVHYIEHEPHPVNKDGRPIVYLDPSWFEFEDFFEPLAIERIVPEQAMINDPNVTVEPPKYPDVPKPDPQA